jgi:hypothetical protein
MAFLLLLVSGCKLEPVSKSHERGTSGSTKRREPELDGGRYCVETMMQGPPVPTPIHFSHKQNSSDGSSKDYQADLSALNFDVTIHSRYRADPALLRDLPKAPVRDGFTDTVRTNHYSRSDVGGWRVAGKNVALAATPWGLFVSKPPATRVGTEHINGYETIKFAVDTTHQSQSDKAGSIAGSNLMGGNLRDYSVKGTVWVTRDTGCILQYAIDSEKDYQDGTRSNEHYEGGIGKP